MNRFISIIVLLLPFHIFAQQYFYKSSTLDYAWQYVGEAGFSPGVASQNSLAFSPSGQPYLAFENYSDSNKMTIMKFDENNWVCVGDSGIPIGKGEYISLAFNPASGQPYVAFQDKEDTLKATVKKFEGNSWVNVGNPGFSSSYAYNLSLAFNQSGQPYVAFVDYDYATYNKLTVMKFDGTNWVYVGNAGFSAGQATDPSIAFSLTDEPYVAYMDWISSPQKGAAVMKFNGTNWENVGNAGFSSGRVNETKLAFNSIGQPYVAFVDDNFGYRLSVMKFDGNNWVYEGEAGFTTGSVDYISFAISLTDQPYVSYRDIEYSGKASVMKFSGNNWVNVGNSGFSMGNAACTSLAFNPISGQPYLAFEDGSQFFEKASVLKYDSVYVSIDEPQKSEFFLYPNPANANLTINFNKANGDFKSIGVYDARANLIFATETKDNHIVLNVENYPPGIYFIKVNSVHSNWIGRFCKN
jgi:hypothetical protein